jgi:uncharacterized low-complexity protein
MGVLSNGSREHRGAHATWMAVGSAWHTCAAAEGRKGEESWCRVSSARAATNIGRAGECGRHKSVENKSREGDDDINGDDKLKGTIVTLVEREVYRATWVVVLRDENGFGIFRNSRNRFRIFSIGITGNGIFRKRNRYRNRRSVLPTVSFDYRFLSENTGFVSRNFPKLCLGIFRNCVSEFSSM